MSLTNNRGAGISLFPEPAGNVLQLSAGHAVEPLIGGALFQRTELGTVGAELHVIEYLGKKTVGQFLPAAIPTRPEIVAEAAFHSGEQVHDPDGIIVSAHKANASHFPLIGTDEGE